MTREGNPEVQRSIPETPFRVNLALNAAFAKFWARELHEPGWTLPYLAAGALSQGELLLAKSDEFGLGPSLDRPLIQSWADTLGLGKWLRWIPRVD